MNLPIVLDLIAREYGLYVYRSTREEKGYYLETNKGPKFVSVWKDLSNLHWYFSWREKLAESGFRQVDRFIRTRGGEPFLQVKREFLVVQDFFQGKPLSFNTVEQVEEFGHLMGYFFQILHDTPLRQPLMQGGLQLFSNREQIRLLKKNIIEREELGLFSHLLSHHWLSLERRWKQARALYDASFPQYLEGANLPYIHLHQWQVLETGHLTFSTSCQEMVFDFQSLAQLMIVLYTELDFSLDAIQAFYRAFSRQKQLTLAQQYNLLAYLICPTTFITIIINYINQTETDEACAQKWLEQAQRQEQVDALHLWFAKLLDQTRQEIV